MASRKDKLLAIELMVPGASATHLEGRSFDEPREGLRVALLETQHDREPVDLLTACDWLDERGEFEPAHWDLTVDCLGVWLDIPDSRQAQIRESAQKAEGGRP